MTPTALRLKTRTLSGRRLEIVVPELNEGEEVELIVLRSEPPPETPAFASAWDWLQSLPPIHHTPEEWEAIEREIQEGKNSWGD